MEEPAQSSTDSAISRQATRFAVLLGLILGLLVVANYWWPTSTVVDGSQGSAAETDNPELGVKFSAVGVEGLPREVILSCDQQMTVFQAFEKVVAIEPAWRFEYQGGGNLVFIGTIAGHTNQGTSGRNWTYEINGELASRGVGEMQVGPGDHVLWKFEPYE